MTIQVPPDGPTNAKIMVCGEAPGEHEERERRPFVGPSGQELNRMLGEVGILRSEVFCTNVARERPPNNDVSLWFAKSKKARTAEHTQVGDRWVTRQIVEGIALLKKEIELVKPNIVIAAGNTSMWSLTGHWGVMRWRGSMLVANGTVPAVKVIPVYHPAAILREWSWRATTVNDLRRAARFRNGEPYPDPKWNFRIRPTIQQALDTLDQLLVRAHHKGPLQITFDLETRSGHIACAGISWSLQDAICLPFLCVERLEGYWTVEEEAEVVWRLYQLLTHPNVEVIGQNLLYDSQYTYRWWHFVPRVKRDTMISHHVAFAGLPKRLDFQASLYCNHYRFWKLDGKNWEKEMGEDQLWRYNAEDCVRTAECAFAEEQTIRKLGLESVDEFQTSMFWPVLRAMQLGVRIDTKARNEMGMTLLDEMAKRESYFIDILGHPLNPRSPKQMIELFYTDFKLPVQIKRSTGKPTLDDDALQKLAAKEPLVRPLIKAIAEYRSLSVFSSTFVAAPLNDDGRLRCSYNICGTETYRLSSSENAFGSGTNLQNLPKGTKAEEPEDLELPNIRKLFIPDPGYTFFDLDLDRADLQVVVWEADDKELKQMLREGVDIHVENAKVLGISRQLAKSWVHGTDYGGGPRTMAASCGITIHEAERMRTRWFAAHPGIKRWHDRVSTQLHAKHYVENRYGYHRFYFDRIDGILSEALAWIPQSTVAVTINKIWLNLFKNYPEILVLLQTHDSLAGEFPTARASELLPKLKEVSMVTVPYEDPLVIPVSIKTSEKSWGDC